MLPLVSLEPRPGRGSLLALDLGTRCGWAISDETGNIRSGEWNLAKLGRAREGLRFLLFRSSLIDARDTYGVDQVTYEEVTFPSSGWRATQLYGGWKAILLAWCETHKIPCAPVHTGKLKKFWSGSGRAGKETMIDVARALGHAPASDNEADAIAILYWTLAKEQGAARISA